MTKHCSSALDENGPADDSYSEDSRDSHCRIPNFSDAANDYQLNQVERPQCKSSNRQSGVFDRKAVGDIMERHSPSITVNYTRNLKSQSNYMGYDEGTFGSKPALSRIHEERSDAEQSFLVTNKVFN